MSATNAQLIFQAPGKVVVEKTAVPTPQPEQLLVQTIVSAISAGTEMLLYRGQLPPELPLDATIDALGGTTGHYPTRYGYAAVGRVTAMGSAVDEAWQNRLVFAFQPHGSHFVARPEQVWRIPDGLEPETAVFLPNMETAVALVMDAQPAIGERVVVFGQGVVGLLTTLLLNQFPLAWLTAVDSYAARRAWAEQLGATDSYPPDVWPPTAVDADLTLELSGNPAALDQAIAVTGDHGRVIIGSWYGQKRATLDLGGRFHRSQMRLISSQVSRIRSQWRGRWDKQRRLGEAARQLAHCRPERLITHRFPITEAAAAYQLLDQRPEAALQVIFTY